MKIDGTCEYIGEQLSGYIDDELTQQEAQRVSVHIEQCEQCRKAYHALEQLKEAISDTSFPNMEEQKMNAILNDLTSRRMFDLSWFAMISGVLIAVVFAAYHFLFDPNIMLFSKLIMSLIWGGGLGLFLTVLRQRLIMSKTDKYNKVEL